MSKLVATSGGFDPIHIGHVRLFEEAKKLGNRLVVILNSDRFLMEKKGYVFMPWEERKEVIEALEAVDYVIECIDKDQTVCETVRRLKPDIFVNGGDRKKNNTPEDDTCKELGIEAVYGVGGGKVQSSSDLIKQICEVL